MIQIGTNAHTSNLTLLMYRHQLACFLLKAHTNYILNSGYLILLDTFYLSPNRFFKWTYELFMRFFRNFSWLSHPCAALKVRNKAPCLREYT